MQSTFIGLAVIAHAVSLLISARPLVPIISGGRKCMCICLCVLYLCVFVSVCAVCGQPFDIGKTVSPDYFMFAYVCVFACVFV